MTAFYNFSLAFHSPPYSPLKTLVISLLGGGDNNEGNISPPFDQTLFVTLSEMKLKMSPVGHSHKNTMHKLLLGLIDLKSITLRQNFTTKVTSMKLTPDDLNITSQWT